MTARWNCVLFVAVLVMSPTICCPPIHGSDNTAARFTPLTLLPSPKIVAHAETYPGSTFRAEYLVDGWGHTEFASNGKGTETFVAFDFGSPVRIAGFKHVDRHDVATMTTSELVFSDQPDFGQVIRKEQIKHADKPSGITVAMFSSPVTAQYVRWNVTGLNKAGHRCLGGADIRFLARQESESSLKRNTFTVSAVQAVLRADGNLVQPIKITVDHVYAEVVDVLLKVGELDPVPLHLEFGSQAVTMMAPAVDQNTELPVIMEMAGKPVLQQQVTLAPVRHWEFFFLPHSHVDIGYTHVQTEVERLQWGYLESAIEIARNTADYPPEARFKWNSEGLWAVDGYLKQASDQKKTEFFEAVRKGWLHLDGLYGNELTGLCRPEELMRLTSCARRISKEHNVVIDSAMISDVPGYTWGTVPVLVQSGIKYLSIGPNHVHRIGNTLNQWGDRPFWWVSPSGQERLLCWMAGKAYSWFHPSLTGVLKRDSKPEPFLDYLDELQEKKYPYDMVQMRYSIGGDNGPPDQELSEFVKTWNEKYVWPRMAITTTSRLMHDFEHRYGDQLPEVRGDFTPYWEDGAGSSAKETSMARMAAERLVQAETLWAMHRALHRQSPYPAGEFEAAWRDVILFNEHTWGAHCSISQPDSPFTLSQWKIKQAFAVRADAQSRNLLERACGKSDVGASQVTTVDVFNTNSWARTDLVSLDADMQLAGHVVRDMDGRQVPSQIIHSGKLVFLARDVPPLGAKRFLIESGEPKANGSVRVDGNVLSSNSIRVELDPTTGAVASLRWTGVPNDLVDRSKGNAVGQYQYVAGVRPDDPQTSHAATIRVASPGGLTGSLVANSDAPGCKRVSTVVRLIDGIDRVDVIMVLDKEKVLTKEAVHIEFPFQVPDGVMRLDIPWAVIRPNLDQLPGACKNYLTIGRWVDVSNDEFGMTWSTLDAPLIEVGDIHMDLDKPMDPESWIDELEPTQTFYSYAMNNYWETNYKASQEGRVVFRYSLMPHRQYDQVAAVKFGLERSQPLVAVPVNAKTPVLKGQLVVEPASVLVTSMKPSEDGQAVVVRLWNAGSEQVQANLNWKGSAPHQIVQSSPFEESGDPVTGPIKLPSMGIVTLRISP